MKTIYLLIFTLLFSSPLQAISWDEPWHIEVVKEADALVLVKVLSVAGNKSTCKVSVLKTIAGDIIQGEIDLKGFYHLNIATISSGDYGKYYLKQNNQYYLFLKRNPNEPNCYSIATPTTGYAEIIDNQLVVATYRISFHQAYVPLPVYERTQSILHKFTHNINWDSVYIDSLTKALLTVPPGELVAPADTCMKFFQQHVAMEMLAMLNIPYSVDRLKLFLHHENEHHAISAARALKSNRTEAAAEALMGFVGRGRARNFIKVFAVMALQEMPATTMEKRLNKLAQTASQDETFWDINLMDDRIATGFPPNLRAACKEAANHIASLNHD